MQTDTYTLNCGGQLVDLSTPQVMGILNLTPDSFYAASRVQTDEAVAQRTRDILSEGGTMIDVGAYSSRPGAADVSPAEEMARLRRGLAIVRCEAPTALVSVDTFRADVARMCVEEFGVQIINDISGGALDAQMFPTVARLGVPYILMHMHGTPQTMQQLPPCPDIVADVFLYFSRLVARLRELGQRDIILDPGFGFAKTLAQNYELLHHLDELREFRLPLLVGVSRKSMICKPLGITPPEALVGTGVLHALALERGANILRVHDVRAAVQAVTLVQATLSPRSVVATAPPR